MAFQAEELCLLRRRWSGPGQIRYGCMEREARAALHLGLRVAAGAVDLRRVAGQRGVAARALELTRGVHRSRAHRMHASGVDGEVGMTVQDAACGLAAVRMAAQASVRIVRITGSVWRGDRRAERHVCREHTAGATGELARV